MFRVRMLCHLSRRNHSFRDIYVGADFDRLFVERVIAHLEPTHGGTAGAPAYSISLFWDKFAGAMSVLVIPSCACDKLSEWVVYSVGTPRLAWVTGSVQNVRNRYR